MAKRTIKLINNERQNTKITSAKGAVCYAGGKDVCTWIDNDACYNYALDNCGKDYTSCYNGADDVCTNVDNDTPCYGAGAEDYN